MPECGARVFMTARWCSEIMSCRKGMWPSFICKRMRCWISETVGLSGGGGRTSLCSQPACRNELNLLELFVCLHLPPSLLQVPPVTSQVNSSGAFR